MYQFVAGCGVQESHGEEKIFLVIIFSVVLFINDETITFTYITRS